MHILIGWNHFKIRSFDPFELGLTKKADPDFKIEVHQNYFHLFGIPFFSLGKRWAIRKDNRLYEMPGILTTAIKGKEQLQLKTPWYTYTGLLLLLLAGFGFIAKGQYDTYQWEQFKRNKFRADYACNISKFRHPTPDDYYVLVSGSGYSRKYAKITGLDKRHIQLSFIQDPRAWASTPLDIANLFDKYAGRLKTVTINRSDSARILCSNYDKRYSFEGLKLKNDLKEGYRVEKIIRLDGPVLHDGDLASYLGGDEYMLSIENEGFDTRITRIDALEGDIRWLVDELPLHVSTGQEFILRGRGDFKRHYRLRITCTNSAGKKIFYLLEGENYDKIFERI